MIKQIFLAMALCYSFFSYANEYELYQNSKLDPPKGPSEKPVDIHVDEPEKKLSITFNERMEAKAIISGPEGVVYNDEISAPRHATLDINLRGCEGGDYNILLIDNAGNVTDSSFYLTETDNQ